METVVPIAFNLRPPGHWLPAQCFWPGRGHPCGPVISAHHRRPAVSESWSFLKLGPVCFIFSCLLFARYILRAKSTSRGAGVWRLSLPTAHRRLVYREAAQAGRRPGRRGPAQLPPVTTCWGSGLRGQEDSPRYWGQESVYFLQKKKRLEDFFLKSSFV